MSYLIANVKHEGYGIKIYKDEFSEGLMSYTFENPEGLEIDSCYGYLAPRDVISDGMLNTMIDDVQFDKEKFNLMGFKKVLKEKIVRELTKRRRYYDYRM